MSNSQYDFFKNVNLSEDGSLNVVLNGAVGATGPQGATGNDGAVGATGATGASVTAGNGITDTNGTFGLGGTLTSPVSINGNNMMVQLGSPVSKLGMIAFTSFCSMTAGENNGVTDTSSTLTLSAGTAGLIAGQDSKVNIGTADSGTFLNVLSMDGDETTFVDGSTTPKGIQYDDDYSSTFVDRSLVDKEYVDGEIASFLENGTGTNSILSVNSSSAHTVSSNDTFVFGGTNNIIPAPAMGINSFGSDNLTVTGPAMFNKSFGSSNTTINGPAAFSNVFGGTSNIISNPTSFSNMFGGQNNTIDFSNSSFTLGGKNNSVSGGGTDPGANSSAIIGGEFNTVDNVSSLILQSKTSSISRDSVGSAGSYNIILGGKEHIINVDANDNNAIVGGLTHSIDNNVSNSIILGGQDITATQTDTAYVPNLVIKNNVVPTSTSDTAGEEGQISFNGTHMFYKTSTGWGRVALDFTF